MDLTTIRAGSLFFLFCLPLSQIVLNLWDASASFDSDPSFKYKVQQVEPEARWEERVYIETNSVMDPTFKLVKYLGLQSNHGKNRVRIKLSWFTHIISLLPSA